MITRNLKFSAEGGGGGGADLLCRLGCQSFGKILSYRDEKCMEKAK